VRKFDNIYHTGIELSLEPPLPNPKRPLTDGVSVAPFIMKLESSSVLIESLQVNAFRK
jgi:hypothetical protein